MHPASLGFGIAAAGSRPPEQSSSATARFAPSFTGSSARSLQCSFPKPDCAEPAVPGHVFCSSHLRAFGMPVTSSQKSTPSSTPGPELQQPQPPPPPPPTGSATNGTAPVPPARNKALPEYDQARPIARRKTAQASFSSSKHPANSSFVKNPAAISASSSAPRPATVSLQGSPEYAANGQPPLKRPRLSPTAGSPSPGRRIDSAPLLGTCRPKAIKTTSQVKFVAGPLHDRGTESSTTLNSNISPPRQRKTAPPEPPANPAKEDFASARKAVVESPSKNTQSKQFRAGGQNGYAGGKQGLELLEKNGVGSFHDKRAVEQPDVRPLQESGRVDPLTPKRPKVPSGINGYSHPKPETESRGESGNPHPASSRPADSTQGAGIPGNSREQLTGSVSLEIPKPPSPQQLERRRRPLDLSEFDRLIYAQEGALNPPPEVCLLAASPAAALKEAKSKDSDAPRQDEPLYLDIDPRIHWPQPHTEAWLEEKQAEIQARGGRKANFGQAAQRLRQQRIAEERVPLEDTLPEKIASNPAWVRMLKLLKAKEEGISAVNGAVCTPSKGTAGPGRGKRPSLGKSQSSSLCMPVNGGNPFTNGSLDGSVYTSE
ncbi:hypothetical protein QBC39DRAFT_153616 [Podospora conica]|nr:hypothetical protein QBC39DRAFT_153616 [Schizothecium conicum]